MRLRLHRSCTARTVTGPRNHWCMNAVTNAEYGRGLLTVSEVAERLRCSEPTVRRRIRDGQIPAVKLGHGRSVIRIDAAELNNWLYQREDNA